MFSRFVDNRICVYPLLPISFAFFNAFITKYMADVELGLLALTAQSMRLFQFTSISAHNGNCVLCVCAMSQTKRERTLARESAINWMIFLCLLCVARAYEMAYIYSRGNGSMIDDMRADDAHNRYERRNPGRPRFYIIVSSLAQSRNSLSLLFFFFLLFSSTFHAHEWCLYAKTQTAH